MMRAWLSFPTEIRKLGVDLLNQQMWLFGCDVRRKQGNLLLDYGFERTRPPEGVKGSSRYARQMPNGDFLVLWGFGLYLESTCGQGLFLKRYEFSPRLMVRPEQAWNLVGLPQSKPPKCMQECGASRILMQKACQWLAEYETWALKTAGLAYRKINLDGWSLKTVRQPQEIAGAWNELAQGCSALIIKQRKGN